MFAKASFLSFSDFSGFETSVRSDFFVTATFLATYKTLSHLQEHSARGKWSIKKHGETMAQNKACYFIMINCHTLCRDVFSSPSRKHYSAYYRDLSIWLGNVKIPTPSPRTHNTSSKQLTTKSLTCYCSSCLWHFVWPLDPAVRPDPPCTLLHSYQNLVRVWQHLYYQHLALAPHQEQSHYF